VPLSELSVRVLVAAVGIPLLLGCTFAGGTVFFLLVVAITLLSLRELARLFTPGKGVGTIRLIGGLGAVAILADAWLWAGAHWGLLLLTGTGSVLLVEVFRKDPQPVAVIGGTAVSWLYLALPLGHFMWLRGAEGIIGTIGNSGAWLVVALWLMVWSSDTAAYFIGVAWGRRKLIPSVSPNKTWEGTVAGVITGAAIGALLSVILPDLGWDVTYGMFMGFVIGVTSVLGDLAESRLKRGAGVKDTGKTLPGHGGILDRFDSILFCVPVMYYLLAV